jgi:hypothetical protein
MSLEVCYTEPVFQVTLSNELCKIHYRAHKRLLLIPLLRQINPISTLATYLCKIHYNILSSSL